ncbi:MAG: UvrD-helicase domain-containing protein [Bacilli bacterium]|nr:UvrD-helicase domain-containing protein [Bacilli bacterium]
MANRWTDEQMQAINVEGNNVIVSAGAGSGKTAVLTERVLRKVKDGISINQLLILTFTKAAAKEMKDRIRRALKKEGYLEQLKLIDSSYITTFDSFSLSVVKKYHTYINVDKNIKITDQTIIDIRKKEILDKIMNKKYQEGQNSFGNLVTHFALKDDTELKRMILSVNSKLDLKYDKKEYLKHYEENLYSEKSVNSSVNEYLDIIKEKQEGIKELVNEISSYLEGDTLEKFNIELNKIINCSSYDSLKQAVDSFVMPRKNKSYTTEAVVLKDEIKSLITDLKDLLIYKDLNEIKNSIILSRDDTLEIVDIVLRLNDEFEDIKQKEGLYDFNDISHLAIKLVKENSEVRDELKYSFQEILIDEYQDTSDTQELFINEIANHNVYMVGDIKQSIYRFRNANPYIFKEKYDTYSKDNNKGIKIDLNKNFRSRFEVLDNINLIFSSIMTDDIGGANYIKDHKMIFGNKSYSEEGNTTQGYNMKVLTYEEGNDYSNAVKEAFIIGNDIKTKVLNHYKIFDKDKKELRDACYSDFAILLDVKKNFVLYKQIFEYLNIPLLLYSDTDLVLSDDIYVLKNLVKFILLIHDNDYSVNFKYCYMSLARSFLFNYSDSDIFDTFKDNSFKESQIYKLALKISSKVDFLPLEELFYEILEVFNYDEKILSTTDIQEKEKRIEYFTNLLSDFSNKGYTLYDLSYYLEQVIENELSIKYKPFQESVNSVKIMSIHTSKGLEFPICYFAGFDNRFNQMDLKEKISFDNNYGIMLPQIDEETIPTIRMKLFRIKSKREDISERIRLFYVALTRAKEEIILVTKEQDDDVLLHDVVSNVKKDKYISFGSIIQSIISLLKPYQELKKDVEYTNDYLYSFKDNDLELFKEDKISVKPLEFNIQNKEESHFSKTHISLIEKEEKEIMEVGTKIHQILEEIDFKNPNLDNLDINSFMKNKISKFLNSDIIKNNINSKMYKEYEFITDSDDEMKRGIVDLIIENNDEVIIIDYKLNNVLDDAYVKQLNGYKEQIGKIINKPIKLYLYSIIGESFEEVI